MGEAEKYLPTISDSVCRHFKEANTILSYDAWFELMLADPARNLRSAAEYARDVFDHYGVETRQLPQGDVDRFNLFDAPWAGGDGRVAGQEDVQQELYRLISNFARDGKITRLILLHGPNGSAKSSIVRCIQSAMEDYSHKPEGALYTYAWILPTEKITKSSLGFGDAPGRMLGKGESYAHLDADAIDARLSCELREHPIFLLPRDQRAALFDRLVEEERLPRDHVISRYLQQGDLSPRDRAIYDALLLAYEGDHSKVLQHVQVQRFYMSVKYRRGLATIDPQIAVDAQVQQLTADRSVANLPRTLQHIPMHQIGGPLVSANRGLLEFADILKRPFEALKYLLTTSEEATASLPDFKLQLDELLIASTNETYLEAFKKNPDWNSFKARIELVTTPYLRRFSDEVEIYRAQFNETTTPKALAPHVIEVAALWSVLTRLTKPRADRDIFADEVKEMLKKLSPIDKMKLYDTGEVPSWCTAKQAKELKRAISVLEAETRTYLNYEGSRGASAREIRTLILNAAHNPNWNTLTPPAVFEELEHIVSDASVYEWLRDEVEEGFHDHKGFIHKVRQWWLDVLDDELRTSMGLVEEKKYDELFARYVLHVSNHVKKEKVFDVITGDYTDPDQSFMTEVETSILAENEDKEDFRRAMIGQIGAWSLEHKGQRPPLRELFSQHIEKMEAEFYRERHKQIAKNLVAVLKSADGDVKELTEEEREMATRTLSAMHTRYEYPEACTPECLGYLLKERYTDYSDDLDPVDSGDKPAPQED